MWNLHEALAMMETFTFVLFDFAVCEQKCPTPAHEGYVSAMMLHAFESRTQWREVCVLWEQVGFQSSPMRDGPLREA